MQQLLNRNVFAFKNAEFLFGSKRSFSTCNAKWSVMKRTQDESVTLAEIEKAVDRIQPYINETPILTSEFMNKLAGRKLYFKCEIFQKAGSFKYRGVTNSILQIKERRGNSDFVAVTHSSGNHGQAVALACSVHNVENIIVVPSIAPKVKKSAIVGYGGKVVECRPDPVARQETADEILQTLGDRGEYIASSDHPFMMAGAGTIGLELLQEVPELDAAVACVSAGGLLAGVSVGCRASKPTMSVFGAEPLLADDTARSFRAKERIVLTDYPATIADGLRMSIGKHVWPVVRDNVTDVITVTEDEIVRATYLLWERMKIVVEPSGAVGLAAVLSEKFHSLPKEIEHVAITLSGGNVDLHNIPWMLHPGKYDLSIPVL